MKTQNEKVENTNEYGYDARIEYLQKEMTELMLELKAKIREDKEPSTNELFQMFYKLAGIVSDVVYLPK